jgi:hypothetical protein
VPLDGEAIAAEPIVATSKGHSFRAIIEHGSERLTLDLGPTPSRIRIIIEAAE